MQQRATISSEQQSANAHLLFDRSIECSTLAPLTLTVVAADCLTVTADIISDIFRPANVALNAIIEDADGVNRFWALSFPDGKPEFHSEACRALRIEA